jgi:hypothetical protein
LLQEQQDLFTVIAAVLHLGNVIFSLDDNDAAMVSDPNGPVKLASVSYQSDSCSATFAVNVFRNSLYFFLITQFRDFSKSVKFCFE